MRMFTLCPAFPLLVAGAAACQTGDGDDDSAADDDTSQDSGVDVTPAALAGGVFEDPLDAAPDDTGMVFYFLASDASSGDAGVFRVDASGGDAEAVSTGAPWIAPLGLVVRGDAGTGVTIWVADPGVGSILRVDVDASGAAGGPVTVPGTEDTAPTALDQRADQLVFSGWDPDQAVPAVMLVPDGGGSRTSILAGAPLVDPVGVTTASGSTLWVADDGSVADGIGTVYEVASEVATAVIEGVVLGAPAGMALPLDETTLWVSSMNADDGSSQVILLDRATGGTAVFNDVIGQKHASGGLHRARTGDVFAWCDYEGTVFRVGIH